MRILPGGDADEVTIAGSLITEGTDPRTLEVHAPIHHLTVGGNIAAHGRGSNAVSDKVGNVDLAGVDIAP